MLRTWCDIQAFIGIWLISIGTGIIKMPKNADRKSTRLNSSHSQISYAVFCLKKKNNRAPAYHVLRRRQGTQACDIIRSPGDRVMRQYQRHRQLTRQLRALRPASDGGAVGLTD